MKNLATVNNMTATVSYVVDTENSELGRAILEAATWRHHTRDLGDFLSDMDWDEGWQIKEDYTGLPVFMIVFEKSVPDQSLFPTKKDVLTRKLNSRIQTWFSFYKTNDLRQRSEQ